MKDDRAFLASLVVGYEIGTRAGIALHRTACDYHTSGAWIAIAAAALGARSMGLDAAQTREAIGIAEYHGPRSQMMRVVDQPTMVKDGSGWGAMAGVSAAYLAAEGFTGAPAVTVEGEMSPTFGMIWGRHGALRNNTTSTTQFAAGRSRQCRRSLICDKPTTCAPKTWKKSKSRHSTTRSASPQVRLLRPKRRSIQLPIPTAVAMVRGRVDPDDVMEQSFDDPRSNVSPLV